MTTVIVVVWARWQLDTLQHSVQFSRGNGSFFFDHGRMNSKSFDFAASRDLVSSSLLSFSLFTGMEWVFNSLWLQSLGSEIGISGHLFRSRSPLLEGDLVSDLGLWVGWFFSVDWLTSFIRLSLCHFSAIPWPSLRPQSTCHRNLDQVKASQPRSHKGWGNRERLKGVRMSLRVWRIRFLVMDIDLKFFRGRASTWLTN